MIIFVNDIKTEVHAGARVKDAVLKFNSALKSGLPVDRFLIRDAYGNERSTEGALSEYEMIYIIKRDNS